jgi:two-component system, OmpR family, sensor histidine kinase MtrB
MHGVRARLALTVVGLVAVTSLVLGIGSYAYVATSLRSQQLDAARELTTYNVAVLAVERLPDGATRSDLAASRLLDGFAARGIAGTLVDFGDGDPFASNLRAAAMSGRLSPDLATIAARGDVAFERTTVGGAPMLITAARRPAGGPTFYFLFDAAGVEDAIQRLGQALLVGGLVLVVLAALVARFVARGLLRPVRDGAGAAERIAAGDLSARLDTTSGDEFAQWAASFNRMAASLERHVADLRDARTREQRFVADVSHELRTPLTALVAEASLLRDQLDALPATPRRIGQLVAGDLDRLRVLVDDLMELSRFDAGAERLDRREFDVSGFVRSTVDARLPGARVTTPAAPAIVATDPRRLERVLGNLLDNARVHAGGSDVEVEVRFDAVEPAAGALPAAAAHPTSDAALSLDEHGASGAPPTPEERPISPAEPGPDPRPMTLVVAVADRGPGVDPAEIPHLFDRFHKADPSRHAGGSGLGLAIAREHARLLGGTLAATPGTGGGMRFEVRIPVTRSLRNGDERVMGDDQAAGQTESRTEPPR